MLVKSGSTSITKMNEQIKQLHEYLGHHGDQWKTTDPSDQTTYEFCEHCDLLLMNGEKIDYLPRLWWFGNAGEVTEQLRKRIEYSHNKSGLYACGINDINHLLEEKDEVVANFVRILSDMIKFKRPMQPSKFSKALFDRLLEINELGLALMWMEAGLFEREEMAQVDE